jgi:ABC-type nitrate/sulfonate/bicarbonate transport system substrate-binding protein
MYRIGLLVFVLGVLAAVARPAAAASTTPATIELGVFSNALPYLVAEQKGFFAAQQLTVNVRRVVSSTQQFSSLRTGEYDIISTNADNVLNYRLNASNALGSTFPVQIFAATQYGGNLALVAQPGTASLADFRGKVLAVDSPSSGFAYVLYHMLAKAGLVKDVDYTVVPCGGGTQRYQAMLTGSCTVNGVTYPIAGGLLSGLQLLSLEAAGYPVLQTIQEVPELNPYLGGAAVATEDWLAANQDVAVRFVAALYGATAWALNPANREEAIAIYMTQPNTSREAAEQQYAIDTDPGIGLIPQLTIDRAALRTVVELRGEFNGFDEAQNVSYLISPASGVYDTSYLKGAERLLKMQGK